MTVIWCTAAMLTVEDPAFWEGVEPVDFGVLPRLQDSVTVIGCAPNISLCCVVMLLADRCTASPAHTESATACMLVSVARHQQAHIKLLHAICARSVCSTGSGELLEPGPGHDVQSVSLCMPHCMIIQACRSSSPCLLPMSAVPVILCQ